MTSRLFCSIYKSSRKDEMYLYVPKAKGLQAVPEALLAGFGQPRHVTDLVLSPERPLARADVSKVMEHLESAGFYLQMPPPPEPWLIQPDQAPAWRRRLATDDDASQESAT